MDREKMHDICGKAEALLNKVGQEKFGPRYKELAETGLSTMQALSLMVEQGEAHFSK